MVGEPSNHTGEEEAKGDGVAGTEALFPGLEQQKFFLNGRVSEPAEDVESGGCWKER